MNFIRRGAGAVETGEEGGECGNSTFTTQAAPIARDNAVTKNSIPCRVAGIYKPEGCGTQEQIDELIAAFDRG